MVWVVTGGASGIGAAICASVRAAGETVVCLDRQPPRDGAFVEVDLTDADATRAAAAAVAASYAVSRFVHNAGAIRPAPLGDVTVSDLAALSQLHLGAPLILLQAFLPAMRAAAFGRVVLIGSRAAQGMATRTAYAATKAGMGGLARTWALELAADGITVNVVAPGPIRGTEMFHAVVPAGGEVEARLAAGVPVRRLGTPEDVARVVMFLGAAGSGFITGQTINVCGGASLGGLAL